MKRCWVTVYLQVQPKNRQITFAIKNWIWKCALTDEITGSELASTPKRETTPYNCSNILHIMAWVCLNQSTLPHLGPLSTRQKGQRRSERKTSADKSRKHEATKHYNLSLQLLPLLKLHDSSARLLEGVTLLQQRIIQLWRKIIIFLQMVDLYS